MYIYTLANTFIIIVVGLAKIFANFRGEGICALRCICAFAHVGFTTGIFADRKGLLRRPYCRRTTDAYGMGDFGRPGSAIPYDTAAPINVDTHL